MASSLIPGPGLSKLTVLEEDNNHVALSYDNVLIVLWRGVHEPRVCEALYDLCIRLSKIQGTRQVGVLVIALEGSRPPSKLARLALQRLHEDPAHVVYRVALVPPEGGFVEAAIRSVIINLRRRLSRQNNHDVFPQLEDAVHWVTENLVTARGPAIDNSMLLSALVDFRHTMRASLTIRPSAVA